MGEREEAGLAGDTGREFLVGSTGNQVWISRLETNSGCPLESENKNKLQKKSFLSSTTLKLTSVQMLNKTDNQGNLDTGQIFGDIMKTVLIFLHLLVYNFNF